MTADGQAETHALSPEAFKRLYPELFYERFLENGIRPDGRALGGFRPVTIGLDAVSTTDASALVKLGNTSVLAGLRLELIPRSEEPTESKLALTVDLTALSSPRRKGDRLAEESACLAAQLDELLASSGAVELPRVRDREAGAAWAARVDAYVLNADGCVLDACLLAVVASLARLRDVPSATALDIGQGEQIDASSRPDGSGSGEGLLGLLRQACLPLSLTCGFYQTRLIADPTAEEEALMDSLASVAVTPSGKLAGFHLPGGHAELGSQQLQDCIATASIRHSEVLGVLTAALEAAV